MIMRKRLKQTKESVFILFYHDEQGGGVHARAKDDAEHPHDKRPLLVGMRTQNHPSHEQ